jgi:hypothetical protein
MAAVAMVMEWSESHGRSPLRTLLRYVSLRSATAALFLVMLASTSWAAEQNPFEKKFGDTSKSINPIYRAQVVEYGSMWITVYQLLGKSALTDKKDMEKFFHDEVEPRLAQMKPTTPEETRLKEAATYVRAVFGSFSDPAALSEAELKARDEFLESVVPADEPKDLPSKLAFFLIRFQQYAAGLGMDLPPRTPDEEK